MRLQHVIRLFANFASHLLFDVFCESLTNCTCTVVKVEMKMRRVFVVFGAQSVED